MTATEKERDGGEEEKTASHSGTVVPAMAGPLGERPPALAGHFCNVPTTVFAVLMSLYPATTCHERHFRAEPEVAARGRYYCNTTISSLWCLRGRSQLSTFMKAYREYDRGDGVWDHCTLFS